MSHQITFDHSLDINALDELIECYAASLYDVDPALKTPYANFGFQQATTKKLRHQMRCREEEYTLVKAYASGGSHLAGFALAQTIQCGQLNFFNIKCLCSRQAIDGKPLPVALDSQLFDACIGRQPEGTQFVSAVSSQKNKDFFNNRDMITAAALLGQPTASRLAARDLFGCDMDLMVIPSGMLVPQNNLVSSRISLNG